MIGSKAPQKHGKVARLAAPPVIPEHSIALRVISCLMLIIAVSCSFLFGESPVPVISFQPMQLAVILLCNWLIVGGNIFSYYYRNSQPAAVGMLIKIGTILVMVNLARELWESNLNAVQFQFVVPVMHALVAATVVTSFELRSRHEIISSATFGLLLLTVAAISGKSLVFGALVFSYICLGTALLILSCRSQTSNALAPLPGGMIRQIKRTSSPLVTIWSGLLVPIVSIAAFCVIPRCDNQADSISTQLRAYVTETLYSVRKSIPHAQWANGTQIAGVAGPNRLRSEKIRQEIRSGKQPDALEGSAGGVVSAAKASGDNSGGKKIEVATSKRGGTGGASGKAGTRSKSGRTIAIGSNKSTGAEAGDGETSTDSEPFSETIEADLEPGNETAQADGEGNRNDDANSSPEAARKSASGNRSGQSGASRVGAGASSVATTFDSNTKIVNGAGSADQIPAIDTKQASSSSSKNGASVGDATTVLDDRKVSLFDQMADPEKRLFTLGCNRSVYTRRATYDSFDGAVWSKNPHNERWRCEPDSKGVITDECPPMLIPDAVPIIEVMQTYRMEDNLGYALPAAGYTEHVSLIQPVIVDGLSNITCSAPLLKGENYTVMGQLPVYAIDAMRAANGEADGLNAESIDRSLQIPADTSRALYRLALDTAGNGNRFARAERIAHYLRTNYKYTFNAVPRSAQSNAGGGGSSANMVEAFLFGPGKTGDCKAFASSFVLLCRAADIPARFVTGFLPGDFDLITGSTSVKRKHSHAWAEIYSPPYGWVPFDATPDGQLPARPESNYYNYARLKKELTKYSEDAHNTGLQAIQTALDLTGKVLGAIALCLSAAALLLAAKALKLLVRNALHNARHQDAASKIRNRLIQKLAKRFGFVVDVADTNKELLAKLEVAARSAPRGEEITKETAAFIDIYNAVHFGGQEQLTALKQADTRIHKMLAVK